MNVIRFFLAAIAIAFLSTIAHAEDVDNPVYQAWAKCKPGATVTIKTVATMEGQEGTREMLQEETLKEITPEGAVIGKKIHMMMGDKKRTLPASDVTVPARIEKAKAGLPMRDLDNVKVLATKEAKEAIELNGKKFDTSKREFTVEVTQDGQVMKGTIQTWTTPLIPGGIARIESSLGKPVMKTTYTATEFHDGK